MNFILSPLPIFNSNRNKKKKLLDIGTLLLC